MKKRVFKIDKENQKEKRKTRRLVECMNINRGVEISVENADTNEAVQKTHIAQVLEENKENTPNFTSVMMEVERIPDENMSVTSISVQACPQNQSTSNKAAVNGF